MSVFLSRRRGARPLGERDIRPRHAHPLSLYHSHESEEVERNMRRFRRAAACGRGPPRMRAAASPPAAASAIGSSIVSQNRPQGPIERSRSRGRGGSLRARVDATAPSGALPFNVLADVAQVLRVGNWPVRALFGPPPLAWRFAPLCVERLRQPPLENSPNPFAVNGRVDVKQNVHVIRSGRASAIRPSTSLAQLPNDLLSESLLGTGQEHRRM